MKTRVLLVSFLVATVVSCRTREGTLVEVSVSSMNTLPDVDRLTVNATVGSDSRSIDVPLTAKSIPPTHVFAIEVSGKLTGTISVEVDAISSTNVSVGKKSNVASLQPGSTVPLSIVLGSQDIDMADANDLSGPNDDLELVPDLTANTPMDGSIADASPDADVATCGAPCHGTSAIIDQWKTSAHYNTSSAKFGAWTGSQPCGNCHANDSIALRAAGTFGGGVPVNADKGHLNYFQSSVLESVYGGTSVDATIGCATCHAITSANDPHVLGKAYVSGQYGLSVPTNDVTLIEKSAAPNTAEGTAIGPNGSGGLCIFCHKSRKDVTDFIDPVASNIAINSLDWGPHYSPDADVLSGRGGYHFQANTYATTSHAVIANGCVGCHMPPNANGGDIGDHSFAAQLAACKGCHSTATSFDILGGQSAAKARLQELRGYLNGAGLLTQGIGGPPWPTLTSTELADPDLRKDFPRPGVTGLTGNQAGALYDYLLVVRGSAYGVHNPKYVGELLYDSVAAMGGTSAFTRP